MLQFHQLLQLSVHVLQLPFSDLQLMLKYSFKCFFFLFLFMSSGIWRIVLLLYSELMPGQEVLLLGAWRADCWCDIGLNKHS